MTAPEPESLTYKHLRTAAGLLLMILAPAYLTWDNFWDDKNHIAACPSTWAAVTGEYALPVLLFAAGLMLFSRQAFLDLVNAVRGLIPGRSSS